MHHGKSARGKCKDLIRPCEFKTIEERRAYNREKYKERKEKLSIDELEKLQSSWKENQSKSRNMRRNKDEVLFKATRANEKCQERAKKRLCDDETFKKRMASEKQKERSKKRLIDAETFRKSVASE